MLKQNLNKLSCCLMVFPGTGMYQHVGVGCQSSSSSGHNQGDIVHWILLVLIGDLLLCSFNIYLVGHWILWWQNKKIHWLWYHRYSANDGSCWSTAIRPTWQSCYSRPWTKKELLQEGHAFFFSANEQSLMHLLSWL